MRLAISTRISIPAASALAAPTPTRSPSRPRADATVDGFWSLTLYNKEHLLSANPLHRYSLGTKSKSMKSGSHGSLTLYVQNTSPGPDKEANWLPAPKDDFSLYIRAYWPKQAILDGTWTTPNIERQK